MKKTPKPPRYVAQFGNKVRVVRRLGLRSDPALPYFHALCEVVKPFRVWKKVVSATRKRERPVIALTLPKGSRFWCHWCTSKCRANVVIAQGSGTSMYDPKFRYERGKTVRPKGFGGGGTICAPGIHFFRLPGQARRFAL